MKILLVCAGGVSTSLLMKKMKTYWSGEGINLEIDAVSVSDYDEVKDNFEIILVGPQIGYRIDEIRSQSGLPTAIIPSMDYGMGNCPNIMKLAKSLYK